MQVKRGDDMHIVLLDSAGGTPVQMTFDHGLTWPFSWSPDGDKIAFAGNRQNFWNVFWVSRTTGLQKKLTTNESLTSYVRYPCWSPLGDSLVYEFGQTTASLWAIDVPAK
jgi:Tol biopolymer transport system component